ncbi:hypothetical protein SteCoe_8858 [Stentor coeruleus]|uniref:Uncharacterized protein n=1 Tax=Stentor coeruleus TaxID=5963 RepID=A0A1R2CJ52_9CILI|nr:hypothetical protein SteCoe_8858 [Stentor coeruleus]
MRRKRIRGIYTNKAVKRCPTCEKCCTQCKGPCKTYSYDPKIRALAGENHTINNNNYARKPKPYRMGIGDYKCTKKFNFFNPRDHKRSRMDCFTYKVYQDFKNRAKKDLEDQLKCYEHELYADSLRKTFKH